MRPSILALALVVSTTMPGLASVLFTFERLNDKTAAVTATGSPDTSFPTGLNVGRFISLVFDDGLVQGSTGGAAIFPGTTFEIGATTLLGFAVDDSDLINTEAEFFDDDVPNVSALITLSEDADWAPVGAHVGSTARVLSDFNSQSAEAGQDQTGIQIGTWEMVAPGSTAPVPLPATSWMLIAGLGALRAAARARRTVERPENAG